MAFVDFLKSGHKPTLFSAFVYSDMSFMAWVLLGPLAVHIGLDLELTPEQQYSLVALPLLAGALLRLPVGVLVDRCGPRRTGLWCQVLVMAALALAYAFEIHSIGALYALGMALGVAGTSMAVALPLVSRWYPDQYQGLALGVAGAASSGTVFAALLAPVLAQSYGWRSVLGLALIPLGLAFLLYRFGAQDYPQPRQPQRLARYLTVLADPDAWWFMLFYAVAFGGVVALASVLVLYFYQQYHIAPASAGYFAAACVLAGSVLRPAGGWLADRWGGIRSLQMLYALVAASLLAASFSPADVLYGMALLMAAMAGLGMASGAVFQLAPLRFRNSVGATTGLIGVAGGLGGFAWAELLGKSKLLSGGFQSGFLIFAGLALMCLWGVRRVRTRWRTTWGSAASTSARV
ncbi:MAG: NarK/NasA family nitrate transporter [Methylococcaceae bacterium]|nr:MAG: NarK/NasA family nitrate transporter [Methylococcaceae bacterium]